jgi:hypothetical protein
MLLSLADLAELRRQHDPVMDPDDPAAKLLDHIDKVLEITLETTLEDYTDLAQGKINEATWMRDHRN